MRWQSLGDEICHHGYDYIHARDGPSPIYKPPNAYFFFSLSREYLVPQNPTATATVQTTPHTHTQAHTQHSSVKKKRKHKKTRGKQTNKPKSIPPCQHKARGPPCCSESGSCNLRQPTPIYIRQTDRQQPTFSQPSPSRSTQSRTGGQHREPIYISIRIVGGVERNEPVP